MEIREFVLSDETICKIVISSMKTHINLDGREAAPESWKPVCIHKTRLLTAAEASLWILLLFSTCRYSQNIYSTEDSSKPFTCNWL